MYKTILITLDQSQLAEQALPHALAIAKAFSSSIELLTVVPIFPAATQDQAWSSAQVGIFADEAAEYLGGVASRFASSGIKAKVNVAQGDIAGTILTFCDESECDLIVMSTHGRSGLGRWVYGSITDRILRHSEVPVLLVRVSANGPE